MIEAPTSVRAAARVGVAPTVEAPPSITPRHRSGHLGLVSVGQLLLAETVLAFVVALLDYSLPAVAVAAVIGLVLVVLAFGRRHGRWWTEWALLRWRFRQRRGTRPGVSDDRRLALMRTLAPELKVTDLEGPDGFDVGIAQDNAGWFAVVAVAPPAGMRGDVHSTLPMDRLVRAVAESNQPGIGLQLLVHTIPAPSVVVDARHRCTTSYRELLEAHGPVPATQTAWVVVRLDAHTLAEATVGGVDSSAQAPTAVAALARRVGKTLGRAGFAHQVLEADGLIDALVRSCDLERPLDNISVLPAPQEHWRSWHSMRFAHATFWLRRWPSDPAGVRPLIGRLITAPAAATNVSLAVEIHEGYTDVRCLVRVAAPANELAAAARAVVQIAERNGGALFPLDGEQAPAVYASAPTGGGMG